MSQFPKVYFQTNDDASFKIKFTDNQRYLNNGEIVFPKNSLGYIVDESELITLVKPCGDPYISFKITDTQFADLAAFEDWFAENAVSTGGGSVDPEQLAGLIADAEYISSATTIAFYNLDGDEVCHIDATAFVKDGMVDNVAISGSNLVITWNTSAGKQPISIPLTDIFNPSNYYDKTATDALLGAKADTSAVTVDEYSIYATRDNIISTAYTSTPITWVKITPKGNLGKSGSLQFSGVTGYLYIQNIDYVNGTYTVGSGSLDPSLVSGLSITFEDGAMIAEVDASNPITYASFSNTVIEYVKEIIPQKEASDAIYDNIYPLIKKVDDSLKSVTVNSASTLQQEIGIRQTKNDGGLANQIVSLDGYLSYSGTTLKAEAYVNAGTDTLTTVAPRIGASSRTDYYFTDNVGQRVNASHIEIQILRGDKLYLAFYGDNINGSQRAVQLTVENGTVTSGNTWPAEATYSLSDGVLTVDYAFTGTTQIAPVSINYILATTDWGSTASVSDIIGYVKALLKDKVEVTEYIENTLKPTIDDIEDSLSGKADVSAVTAVADSLSGKQDTLLFYTEEDNTQNGTKDAKIETTIEDTENGVIRTAYVDSWVNDVSPYAELNASTEVSNSEEVYEKYANAYVDSEEGVHLDYYTHNDIEQTTYEAQLNINADGISLNVDDGEDAVSFNVTAEGVTINDDPVVTESALSGKADTSAVTAISDSLSGKQDTLIAGSGITISGNVISADGGGGGGATYSAGTNISIDTANTINCTLPITAGTNGSLVLSNNNNNVGFATRALAGGEGCVASSTDAFAFGVANTASSTGATAFGMKTRATVRNSFAIGKWNDISDANTGEAFGSSGNTLFAVGNGWKQNDWTAGNASYHNALEIRQNGDIYFADTDNTTYQNFYEKPMIRLQDVTASLGGLKFVKCTQVEYDALVTKDANTLYIIDNTVNNNS